MKTNVLYMEQHRGAFSSYLLSDKVKNSKPTEPWNMGGGDLYPQIIHIKLLQ